MAALAGVQGPLLRIVRIEWWTTAYAGCGTADSWRPAVHVTRFMIHSVHRFLPLKCPSTPRELRLPPVWGTVMVRHGVSYNSFVDLRHMWSCIGIVLWSFTSAASS